MGLRKKNRKTKMNHSMNDKTRESETQTNGIANSNKCGGIFPGEKWLEMKISEAIKEISASFHEQICSMQGEIQSLKSSINELTMGKETLNDLQQVSDAALEQLQTESQSFQEVHENQHTMFEKSKNEAIREVNEDIQSVKVNICEMLSEVPEIAVSSLESRFSNIEERISMSENNSLFDIQSQFNNEGNITVSKSTS